jgi:hypothetical protein
MRIYISFALSVTDIDTMGEDETLQILIFQLAGYLRLSFLFTSLQITEVDLALSLYAPIITGIQQRLNVLNTSAIATNISVLGLFSVQLDNLTTVLGSGETSLETPLSTDIDLVTEDFNVMFTVLQSIGKWERLLEKNHKSNFRLFSTN